MRPITPPGPISCNPGSPPTAKQLANRLRVYGLEGSLYMCIPRELANQIIENLESQDDRVTGLIRACSAEVIKRRVYRAKLEAALEALQSASKQFRYYARQHREKGTHEASQKAQTNDMMADQMEAAMIVEINPDDYGKI